MGTVRLEKRGRYFWIILNRPEVYHAVNFEMMAELETALAMGNEDEEADVILLTGEGEKAFASGGDVREFHSLADEIEVKEMLLRMAHLLRRIASSPKLTVAVVNGVALGGGAELTTAFDLRVASEEARIGFIQRNLHLTSGWGGGTRLMHLIGADRAFPLLLSGKRLTAKEWMELGYLHGIFPSLNLRTEVERWLEEMLPARDVLFAYKRMKERVERYATWISEIEEEVAGCTSLWFSPAHLRMVEQFLSKSVSPSPRGSEDQE